MNFRTWSLVPNIAFVPGKALARPRPRFLAGLCHKSSQPTFIDIHQLLIQGPTRAVPRFVWDGIVVPTMLTVRCSEVDGFVPDMEHGPWRDPTGTGRMRSNFIGMERRRN